jgi:uncharacterized protein
MRSPDLTTAERDALAALEPRLGPGYVRQRLGLERDFEATGSRRRIHLLNSDNRHLQGVIRSSLRLVGLHGRGRRNALAIQVRSQEISLSHLPQALDGFTLLQLSDLHVDINAEFVDALIERVRPLDYDVCVITGDYRARTFGPFEPTLARLEHLRPHLKGSVFGVLGDHDTLRLVPRMEAMGYTLLINECTKIERGGEAIYLAGIDDAHFYRLENFQRATERIPHHAASILLSHTPETYRQAAHAGFNLMLCGHTHGGQICLPGGIPVFTLADSPRALARGLWRYNRMVGYTSAGTGTSIVDIRLNCPPEVTLHRLRAHPATPSVRPIANTCSEKQA